MQILIQANYVYLPYFGELFHLLISIETLTCILCLGCLPMLSVTKLKYQLVMTKYPVSYKDFFATKLSEDVRSWKSR